MDRRRVGIRRDQDLPFETIGDNNFRFSIDSLERMYFGDTR